MRRLIVLVVLCLTPTIFGAGFLFDCTRGETIADADWVIDADSSAGGISRPDRYPTPDQRLIEEDTQESFWTGGVSAWGIELVKAGHRVETLPIGGRITYGDCSNPQDLSFYDVYIVIEPQTLFRTGSDTILQFVSSGGGLCMIANHCGSDRNNNGYDSAMIWNEFGSEQAFGIHFEINEGAGTGECNITEAGNNNFLNDPDNPILHGPFGDINPIGLHNSTTMTLLPEMNARVKALAWRNDASHGKTQVTLATSQLGNGRIVALGDSSPSDDGTGDPEDDLVNGWSQNWRLFLNASVWLAEPAPASAFTPCPGSSPTPSLPTPLPSPTPTPAPSKISIDIISNQLTYHAGDPFLLQLSLRNMGTAIQVDAYVALEVAGRYWFWPSWTHAIDHKSYTLPFYIPTEETILDFQWPTGAGTGNAVFWAAATAAGSMELFDYDYAGVSWQ